ncbi:DISARM system SNF2-like helicase DrmD [Bifidobacterium leontopitheci]|uniref:DISARM system SNF2-like helicase DrmD n=1 Tax=Bifidobacterium leontopitheci TaxID=2650774 RepID=UPI001D009339|nr:DISARM system SNF2-like helicase DrmD [Bifidobacterium leontopitheci]
MAMSVIDGQRTMPALPEVGNIVEVRGATWAVTDVTEQGLSRSPADESRSGKQHVVSLQSLEEDRMGEELSVIWELEIGQTVIPSRGLPDVINADSFDDPNRLGAFVDAMRWGAITSADDGKFEAPFRTGANLEPYQLEPLRRAITAPRTNLLLADDVGLGKTIEAGMVIQELLLRHRARTAIIVCPPSLCLQWQDEMREKFGLDFVIINSAALADARRQYGLGSNPFRLFPRVIVSMAWVPSVRAQRLLEEMYAEVGRLNSARRYSFDLLVVDEAHHVAPAAPNATGKARGYAVDSKRTEAVRRLAEHCEHRLFLSATPHNGYSESFTALLEMVDSRRFTRGAGLTQKALDEVMVRRLKTQISDLHFKQRRIEPIPFTPTSDEESHYQLLDDILTTTAKTQPDRHSLGITALLFKKRLLSSPWAFSRTLGRYLDEPDSDAWDPFDDGYYTEVMGSGQSDEEEGLEDQPESEALRKGKADNPLEAAQPGQLEELSDWAHGFEGKPNSRLQALIDWLDATCRPNGRQQWNDERVVVFTEYADTLDWIQMVLESRGYGADRLAVINGATSAEDRERIRAQFNTDPAKEPIRVLLATDAAGEGINLQTYCHRLVNFDVPFNPSRLEQRIGRIDRYGQTRTPEIYYFCPDDQSGALYHADMEFMQRIVQKVAVEQQDMGTVNPLIDHDIVDRFLHSEESDNSEEPQASKASKAEETDEWIKKNGDAINHALAGSMELNKQLTNLAQEYEKSKKIDASVPRGRASRGEHRIGTHEPASADSGRA